MPSLSQPVTSCKQHFMQSLDCVCPYKFAKIRMCQNSRLYRKVSLSEGKEPSLPGDGKEREWKGVESYSREAPSGKVRENGRDRVKS